MLRVTRIIPAAEAGAETPADRVVLERDERHLRRKAITLESGVKVLVDLAEPVVLEHGDRLVLEDGRSVEVCAAVEKLYEITGQNQKHIAELAWHIGNRHLPAQIEADRIYILHDHVIRTMLEGLGAAVKEVEAIFAPVRGAYSGGHSHHGHGHDHHHHDHHHHSHGHHHHHKGHEHDERG